MKPTKPVNESSVTAKATILALALAMILAPGCATKTNQALEEARLAYQRASTNEQITQNAPVSLHEAQVALTRAERAFGEADEKEVDALAYVAIRRVEIAEVLARETAAQAKTNDLGKRRTAVLLESRDAELAELKAKKTERGLMITLDDVLFEFGKADLKAGSARGLDQLASLMTQYSERALLVEGHTDNIGSDAANTLLSQHRADAVSNALGHAGIDPTRITARGLSMAYPVASNSTAEGRQQNRRVEIIILPEGKSGQQAAR